MNFIFGKWYRDILFLYSPFFLLIGLYFNNLAIESLFYIVTTVTLIDIGHIYTTNIQTTFNSEERKKKYVFLIPLIIFTICLIWGLGFNFKFYFSIMMYCAMLHNVKQGFGVLKWYEKKNLAVHSWCNKYYYALTLIPLIGFHFKELSYAAGDNFTNRAYKTLFKISGNQVSILGISFDNLYLAITFAALAIVFSAWIIQEYRYYQLSKKLEIPRISFIFFYAFIHIFSLLIINNPVFSYAIVVGIHGWHYFVLMSLRVSKVENKKAYLATFKVLAWAFLGVIVSMILIRTNLTLKSGVWATLAFAVYSVPVFSHFLWDGYTWKKQHVDGVEYFK